MKNRIEKHKVMIRYIVLAVAVTFVIYGAFRGEVDSVFSKAIRLCMECVGIG